MITFSSASPVLRALDYRQDSQSPPRLSCQNQFEGNMR